jgi:hypothetical protein
MIRVLGGTAKWEEVSVILEFMIYTYVRSVMINSRVRS